MPQGFPKPGRQYLTRYSRRSAPERVPNFVGAVTDYQSQVQQGFPKPGRQYFTRYSRRSAPERVPDLVGAVIDYPFGVPQGFPKPGRQYLILLLAAFGGSK